MSDDAKREANRLAFNIGMFTGACDAYLGRHHFAAKARVRAKENCALKPSGSACPRT